MTLYEETHVSEGNRNAPRAVELRQSLRQPTYGSGSLGGGVDSKVLCGKRYQWIRARVDSEFLPHPPHHPACGSAPGGSPRIGKRDPEILEGDQALPSQPFVGHCELRGPIQPRKKIFLEDRFQPVQQHLLTHSVIDRRDAKIAILPLLARLWDAFPSHWLGRHDLERADRAPGSRKTRPSQRSARGIC